MNEKYIFYIVFLILTSCGIGMRNDMIVKNAFLVDLVNENEIQLTQREITNLNELLQDGLKWTNGEKFQVGNLIKVNSNIGKLEVYLYDDGYLQISNSDKYYQIDSAYMNIFKNLNRDIQ